MTTRSSRTLSVSIGRPPGDVHAFASDPENLPKWAKGLVERDLRALKDLLEN